MAGSPDTMDDLVWSVTPHEDDESRARLLELVPSLLKALREGLVSAAFDPFSTGDFFTQLEALHVQTLQRIQQPQATQGASGPAADASGESIAAAAVEAAPTMVEVVDEIVLLAPGEPRARAGNQPAGQRRSADPVDNLRVGSWVEFRRMKSTSCAASWPR